MGTTQQVQATVNAPTLAAACNSIGAHLGAKLGAFHSDERTLTDELCDMFAVWASRRLYPPSYLDRFGPLNVSIQKLTPAEENRRGGDLEIEIVTPHGHKRALFQAKVIDPDTLSLRGNSSADRTRLLQQMNDAEADVGRSLTFLLLYVPWSELDGRIWQFATWEQGFAGPSSGTLGSFMGTSVVPLTDLSSSDSTWRFDPPLKHIGNFLSPVAHLSLTQTLLELVACARGDWASPTEDAFSAERDVPPEMTHLRVGFESADERPWDVVEGEIRTLLEYPMEWDLDF